MPPFLSGEYMLLGFGKDAFSSSKKKPKHDAEYVNNYRAKIERFWDVMTRVDPDGIAKQYYSFILDELFEEDWERAVKEFMERISMTKSELEKSQDPNHTGGRKFDGGKLQYGLLPPLALRETVKVLTFGAEKYEPDNWRRVPDGPRRYFDAAQRHLWAYKEGEKFDPETGVNHLAHALCCLMFMLDLDEDKK